jgi:N,N-dimethylformamidase
VFEGIEAESIGGAGLNMGGAVAFEFDRHEPLLGAPEAVILARAVPTTREFFRTFEDGCGSAPDPLVRCDMTLWNTPWGGNVFSLGSVTATGCLPINKGNNDLARLCSNVLRRFVNSGS